MMILLWEFHTDTPIYFILTHSPLPKALHYTLVPFLALTFPQSVLVFTQGNESAGTLSFPCSPL